MAPTNSQDVSWYLDYPEHIFLGTGHTLEFNPFDFGILPGETIQISYRYSDADGCLKFCCKNISLPNLTDVLILDFDEVCGSVGSKVLVPLRAKDFINIATGTFTVALKNDFAKILGIDLVELPEIGLSNVINDQKAVFSWFEQNTNGVTLPDNAILLNLELEILGNGYQSSEIYFTLDPAPLDFANADLQSIQVVGISGEVCLSTKLTISGRIEKPNGSPVGSVEVNLNGGIHQNYITSTNGAFEFEVDAGLKYELVPERDGDDRNGVSGIDVLLMQRHLLFLKRFDSPYQWVAADLNNDGAVTGVDLLLLRRLILFITPEFQFVNSWKFVDKAYDFPSANPLSMAYPEIISYILLNNSQSNQDFIAVKMGDLDNSANLKSSESQKNKSMCQSLIIDNKNVTSGDTISVKFKAQSFENIAVLTSELKFDKQKLTFDSFVSSDLEGLNESNISSALLEEGFLLINWVSNSGLGINLTNDSDVFTLKFICLANTNLKEAISMTNVNINSEMVDGDLSSICLDLMYNSTSAYETVDFKTEKFPYPNPFKKSLILELNSIERQNTRLYLTDINGNIVKNEQQWLNTGSNRIEINFENDNLSNGVYILKLIGKNSSISYKLVYID
jgi:hypothetical protein